MWYLSCAMWYLWGLVCAAETGEERDRGGRGVVSIIMIPKRTGMKGRVHGHFR